MSLQSIGDFLQSDRPVFFEEGDIRYFIERYLREMLGGLTIRCSRATDTAVVLVAPSAAVRQALFLAERTLREELDHRFGFTFTRLKITQW